MIRRSPLPGVDLPAQHLTDDVLARAEELADRPVIDAIPKSASGKLLRRELKRQALADQAP
jgi:acyl-CoA synthetase (AMP-forming)/AMP-acid ligase II